MRILINGKTWYNMSDFDDYEEIEELGEITDTIGIPDGLDLEDDWDAIQEYLKLADDEQAIMLAYAEATGTFDWDEAQEAYAGQYDNGADFAQSLCEEFEYIPKDLPDFIKSHIDWQAVWDAELHWDYTEQDGYYFLTV